MALFYDHSTEDNPLASGLHRFERVYCLAFSEFTEEHFARLQQIYESLPGWIGYRGDDGCPWWFGANESGAFLWASIEPSGLLVHAVLSEENWRAWDEAFRKNLLQFPTFEV